MDKLEEEFARALCVADGKNPDADWRASGDVFLTVALKHPETWRLYQKQAHACAVIARKQVEELEAALNMPVSWELSYCEDGDLSECSWRVHAVNGGINDREWTLLASGETPLEALVNARAALHRKGVEPK